MSVKWWKIWEGLDVKNPNRVEVNSIDDLTNYMIECDVDESDVLNKLVSSVRNYCYNRGYRKDNYKSDGVLKEENKVLMKKIKELEKGL